MKKVLKQFPIAFALLGLLISSIAITACKKVYQDPTVVDFYDMDLVEQRDTTMLLSSWIVIENPNKIPAVIEEVQSKIYIDTLFVGSGYNTKGFELKPQDTTHIPFESELQLSAFSSLYPQLINTDSVELRILGDFKVQLPVVKLKMNMKKEATVKVASKERIMSYIQASLEENNFSIKPPFVIKANGFTSTQVTMNVEIKNDFAFPYDLSSVELDIHLANSKTPAGHWSLNKPISLGSHATVELPVTIQMDNKLAFGQFLGGMFAKKAISANVKGEAVVDIGSFKFTVPVDIEKKGISFSK